jgi:hypothetical protein
MVVRWRSCAVGTVYFFVTTTCPGVLHIISRLGVITNSNHQTSLVEVSALQGREMRILP